MRWSHFGRVVVLAASLMAVAWHESVLAQSPPTRAFGTVTINGRPAPEGAVVKAFIKTTECGEGTVRRVNEQLPLGYVVDVASATQKDNCAFDDDPITFTVNGVPADQTGTFATGTFLRLDLTVSGSAPAQGTAVPTAAPPAATATATAAPATATAAPPTPTSAPATATATAAVSPTATAAVTATPAATAPATTTATATATPAAGASPSPAATGTPDAAASPSPAASPTPGATPAVAPTVSGTGTPVTSSTTISIPGAQIVQPEGGGRSATESGGTPSALWIGLVALLAATGAGVVWFGYQRSKNKE